MSDTDCLVFQKLQRLAMYRAFVQRCVRRRSFFRKSYWKELPWRRRGPVQRRYRYAYRQTRKGAERSSSMSR